ncbi:MAG: Na/Pi symporter, partial [Gammaproteobacteria bacterium]|nr:Na/Pi symporter [Gammaproteobacteria bacterium]
MEYSIGDFLRLLGSLGLFLYGMKIMSDALMSLAGERMRSILARMTSNRFLAVFVGFGITAIIQSSSATTLMVVGFANANLLSLTESIAVIMGTNIGTTVTAWLITILGFKINIAQMALPFMGLGFVLTLKKQDSYKNWGYFIIGFALLFIGLEYLKGSVPDLKSNPEVLSFLQAYTSQGYLSLFIFLMIGTVLTVVVQSSSATMAITIVMCVEGWIPFDMAAAMVLGFNIGTTITANIGAFVANYHAKRAARAHLIFNVIGVSLGCIFFYPFIEMIDKIVISLEGESAFAQILVIPVALSLFHTVFNILNTLLLINAIGLISRIVIRITPEVVEKRLEIERPHYLSPQAAKYQITALKALLDESLR